MKARGPFRRLLSLLLLLSMVLGLLPPSIVPAKAEEAAIASNELSSRIEALAKPVVSYTEKVDLSTAVLKELAGSYVLVSTTADGTLYALKPQISGGKLSSEKITIENGRIVAPTRDMLTYLIKGEPDCSYYLLQNYDRKTIDIRTRATPAGSTYPYTTECFYSTSQSSCYGLGLFPVNEHTRLRVARWLDIDGDGLGDMNLLCCDEEGASFRFLAENHGIRYMDAYRAEPLARDLYDLLQAAAAFTDSSDDFDAAAYSTFTAAVESSISLYNAYNRELSSEEIATAREELNKEHLKLRKAMFALGNSPKAAALLCWVNTLTMPTGATKYGNQRVDLTGVTSASNLGFLDRNYFFVAEVDGEHYVFDKNGNGDAVDVPVTVNALFRNMAEADLHINGTKGHYQYSTLTLWHISGNNGFRMGMARDYFLGYNNGSITKTRSQYIVHLVPYDQKTVAISIPDTNTVIGLSEDKKTFEIHQDSGTSRDRFYLYRFLWSVDELYTAVHSTMRSYLSTPEKYDKADYHGFLDTMETCLELYERYNMSTVDLSSDDARRSENIHEVIRDQRNNLVGYKTLLDDTLDHIDIPVTMMDFRSDGLLMQTKYQLFLYPDANVKDPAGNSVSLPGSLLYPNVTSVGNVRMGLTEPTLTADGKVKYIEELVSYVAASLYSRRVQDLSWNAPYKPVPNAKDHMNYTFLEIAGSVDTNKTGTGKKTSNGQTVTISYGSYEETEEKAKSSGGMFTWDQVTTWYDMAYYLLNYLWEPVPETEAEKLPDGFLYNRVVPEITTMRMYKDDSGEYIFTSDGSAKFGGGIGRLSYSSPYMYNSVPSSGATEHPMFAPLDGLGFESDPYNETDVGSSRGYGYRNSYVFGSNCNFSMHAHGSFIYYEDQNLHFKFRGDDDVMFFINGRMACDIGAAHGAMPGELKLNEKAEELGLKDGELYTFDMFYAERNATGSNITFTTNIKILDNETVTSKGQYLEVSGGKSVVDPASSMGGRLDNNSFVSPGDTIAYSFELLNKRQVPVYNVSFEDENLGVRVSTDDISLSDPNVSTNGVSTTLDDLIILYRSCDAQGTVDTRTPVVVEYEAFLREILNPALTGETTTDGTTLYDPIREGSFRVEIESAAQLQTLLRMGVPSRCQLILYGFKRNTVEGDTPFTNVLQSTCYYDHPLRKAVAINGTASRALRVMVQQATDLPTADPDQVILDYGKQVYIPLEELRNHVYTNRDVSVGQIVGFLPTGVHGTFLKNEPRDMILTNIGDSHKGAFGSFERQKDSISFTPDKFLTNTDSVYAVIALEGCFAADAADPTKLFPCNYILVEVCIQPATVTYYETDFAEGIFTTSAKVNGGDASGDWTEKTETAPWPRIHKEDVPDNAFFVDFDGTGYLDRYRDNPIYGGMDLDNLAYWVSFTEHPDDAAVKDHPTLDQKEGTISVAMRNIEQADGSLKPSTGALYVQPGRHLNENYALRIKPSNNMFLQMRFKLENFQAPDGNAVLDFGYYTWNSKYSDGGNTSDEITGNYLTQPLVLTADHVSGEFVTVRIPITSSQFAKARYITAIRPSFKNLISISSEQLGKLTIDYIYLGPDIADHQDFDRAGDIYYSMEIDRELIPHNAFFVDFDGEGYEDRYRDNPLYKGVDFDRDGWGYKTSRISKVEYDTLYKEAMVLTVGTSAENILLDHIFKPYTNDPTSTDGVLLDYKPSDQSIFEIRLKFDGFSNTTVLPGVAASYFVPKANSTFPTEKALTAEQQFVSSDTTERGTGSSRSVSAMGQYATIRMELTDQFYREELVQGFRIWFTKIKGTGTITIDYIYIGPAYAPAEGTNAPDYLYFGFDDSPSDALRYDTALYGNTNFDKEENWSTYERFELTTEGGIAMLRSTADMAGANGCFGSMNLTGISYTPVEKNYMQIRFRVDGVSNTVPNGSGGSRPVNEGRVSLYYGGQLKTGGTKNGTAIYSVPITEVKDQGWLVRTIPLDEIVTDENAAKLSDYATVTNLALAFSEMGVEANKVHYQVDYFYVGPYAYLPERDTGAVPLTDNALFFDFTNTDADKTRYSSPIYGGYNYDLLENWYWSSVASDPVTIENGELILTDNSYRNKIEYNSITNKARSLRYVPGDQDYCIARVKLVNAVNKPNMTDSGDIGYSNNGRIEFSLYCYYEGYDNYNSWRDMGSTFIDPRDADGDYMTLCFPLTSQYYLNADRITAVQPQFHICDSKSETEKAVCTIDYLYIGPLSQGLANPTVRGLYFNYDDNAEDRIRYENDSYGYIQLDTQGTWGINSTRDKSVTTDNEKGIVTIDTTGIVIKKDEQGNIISDTEDGFSWFQTGLMGEGVSAENNTVSTLDFHPDEAQIAQIRFRIEGARKGLSDGLVYLQYFYDGTRPYALATAGSATVDGEKLSRGDWVTATIPLNDEFRNCNSVTGICPGFHRLYWAEEDQPIKLIVDYVYVGPGEIPPVVYGYDRHYTDDPGCSDYSSIFTVGRGINLQSFNPQAAAAETYTEAEFTFTGTGFDLISRTNQDQATLRVAVYDQSNTIVKTLTVNNKGELELYQIPVASVQGLAHGTYRVVIGVHQAVDGPYDFLDRGGEFYFDAVRIYDPMIPTPAENWEELYAYRIDKEAYEHFKEIRNILLEAEDMNGNLGELAGAIFVDSSDPTGDMIPPVTNPGTTPTESTAPTEPTVPEPAHITAKIETYNKLGPKNEVYLDPGQAIAYKVNIASNQDPFSIDIGVKTLSGSKAALKAGFVKLDSTETDPEKAVESIYAISAPIESSTAQYYALPTEKIGSIKGSSNAVYLVIYNASDKNTDEANPQKQVLSITDMKIAYKAHPNTVQEDHPNDPQIPSLRNAAEPVRCSVDSYTLLAAEAFINEQRVKIQTDPSIEIKHTLNLASDISINYVVPARQLENCTQTVLVCDIPVYEGNDLIDRYTAYLEPVLKGEYYYFTLEGLTAVQIADVIDAHVEFVRDNRLWMSEIDSYSIADYAYSQLGKADGPQKLKSLCAELLRYGSAAQSFKGYRTDALVDQAMTEEQRGYLTDLNAVTFGNHNRDLGDLKTPTVLWVGKSLLLDSKVTLRYVFNAANYSGSVEELSLRVTYKDHKGETKTATVTGAQPYGTVAGRYSFDFDGLLAAELRSVLRAAVYAGETQVSNTLEYSVDTYGNNKEGTLGTLCKALMAYSDAALAYFA